MFPSAQTVVSLPFVRKIPWLTPLRFVPRPLQELTVGTAANLLLREQLQDGQLDFLEGATLGIEISDLDYLWVLSKRGAKLVIGRKRSVPDVTIRGGSHDFLLLAGRREDPDTLFFQRRLVIEGDTELGLQAKNLIDSIDLDQFPAIFNRALQYAVDIAEQVSR